MATKKEITFEEAYEKLEEVADNMEREDISLEDAMKNYEMGIKYLDICKKILSEAERKIETYKKEA